MIKQEKLYRVFIWGFLFLYLLVAGISFIHAIEFFSIGNPSIMAGVLAFAFELGLALSLAAILLSDANKKQTLPWILMIVLTFVQVVGNVYSTFKHIAMSDVDYYVYLQKPLLFWIEEVSQDTVQIIISWIIGAILPIVALFMTDMVASNIKNMEASRKEKEIEDTSDISEFVEDDESEATSDDEGEEEIEEVYGAPEQEKEEQQDAVEEPVNRDISIEKIDVNDKKLKNDISTNVEEETVEPIPHSDFKPTTIKPIGTDLNPYKQNKRKLDDPYFESPETVKGGK